MEKACVRGTKTFRVDGWRVTLTLVLAAFPLLASAQPARAPAPAESPRPARTPTPQPRPFGSRVDVDPPGRGRRRDSVVIHWTANDHEIVRILGIDTPETRHLQHQIPYSQSFGPEARGFAMGAFAAATKVELLRSAILDPYDRTLGYLFVNGRNFSVLAVAARMAEETVSRYGDNGLPAESAAVLAAAKAAGPPPFESPGEYRKRMRDVSRGLKEKGEYPEQ
jgi:endonuclease YncB( thermonuclease family)